MKNIITGALLLLSVCAFVGCEKMNDLHDVYLRNGEIVYIGSVDSIKAFPGKERFALKYWITDPRAKVLTVYWSQKKDSIVVDIPAHQPTDSVQFVVGNPQRLIPEGSLTLQFLTRNGNGLRSIIRQKNVNIYGNRFAATLMPRLVKKVTPNNATSDVTIDWYGASSARETGIEFSYYNLSNQAVKTKLTTIQVGVQTILKAVDKTKALTYRTMYLPEPLAIDTFYTDFVNVPF